MNINCISVLIYEVIKLNQNDELIISKNKFYESEIVKEIFKKFKYNNIEYLLTGTMSQKDFEKILDNLFFPD